MPVETEASFTGPLATNGVTTEFPFAFQAASAAEIAVMARDAAGHESEVPPTAWGVTLAADGAGGTVHFAIAPAPGVDLFIRSAPDFTQRIAFENGSRWLAGPVNEANDRAALKALTLRTDIGRSMLVPLGEDAGQLPRRPDRADRLLGFDPAGDPHAFDVSAGALETLGSAAGAIVTTAENIEDVVAVSTNLAGANSIGTVAGAIANVNAVGANVAAIAAVKADLDLGVGSFIRRAPEMAQSAQAFSASAAVSAASAAATLVSTSTAVARERDTTPVLWRGQFKPGNAGGIILSTNGTSLASGYTDCAVGLDCGTGLDIEPGVLLDAVWTEIAVSANCARIDVTVYSRDIVAATAAGAVNSAPTISHDTVVGGGTVTYTPAQLGITPGLTALATPTAVLLAPIYTASGRCYVVRWEPFDAGGNRVALAIGYKQTNTAVKPQRLVGWYKSNLSTTEWTNQTNTDGIVRQFVRGFRRKELDPVSEWVSLLNVERERHERMAFRRAIIDNDAELLAQSKIHAVGVGVTYAVSGDSLNAQTFGSPSPASTNHKSSDVLGIHVGGTTYNNAFSGHRIDQVGVVIASEPAGATGRGAIRHFNGGTNDIGQSVQGTSIATIQQMHDRVVEIVGDGNGSGGIITTANWTFGTGRVGAGGHSLNYGMARALLRKLRLTYGPKIYDLDTVNIGYDPASEVESRNVRSGQMAVAIASDLTHWTEYGARAYGLDQARLCRAFSANGAPFVHQEVIGIYDGSIAGTATVNENGGNGGSLILSNGSLFGVSCVSQNLSDDVARINPATGAITRGAGVIKSFGLPDKPAARDLLVRADGWGGGHVGRKALVRLMEGTAPLSAVRLVGNGATSLVASEALATDGKELSIVWYFRLNNIDPNALAQKGNLTSGAWTLTQSGATVTATVRSSSSSIITTVNGPKPQNPYGWQALMFSIDALNGVAKIRINGATVIATSVQNLTIPISSMLSFFGAATSLPLVGIDMTMLWMCDRYMDPSNDNTFGTFFDLETFVPKDIGGGAVTTISGTSYQPFVHLFGTAGDYLTGRAQRVGGDNKRLYPPLYSGASNTGFIDVMR